MEITRPRGEEDAADNRVEDKIEDDGAFDPAGQMNQRDQSDPIDKKLQAGESTELVDARTRRFEQTFEKKVEEALP